MEMEGNCMIEIEKPKIECVEDPANGTYGKFTVERERPDPSGA